MLLRGFGDWKEVSFFFVGIKEKIGFLARNFIIGGGLKSVRVVFENSTGSLVSSFEKKKKLIYGEPKLRWNNI